MSKIKPGGNGPPGRSRRQTTEASPLHASRHQHLFADRQLLTLKGGDRLLGTQQLGFAPVGGALVPLGTLVVLLDRIKRFQG